MGDWRTERITDPAAAGLADDLVRLYADVYAEPPYLEGPAQVARFARQLPALWTGGGFALARATDADGQLIGVAYGMTMAPGHWFGDTGPPPAELLRLPRFVLMEWMVGAPWRRRGIGRGLLDLILADRDEPWAMLMANPAAPASRIHAHLGWRKIGTATPELFPPMDVLVRPLTTNRR
jgi:hypothetical protein